MRWFNTPPLCVTDLPAKSDHHGDLTGLRPRFIVLHATGGTDSRDWLTRTSDPPVSVHRLISREGVIYKILPDEAVAWHVGRSIMFPDGKGSHTNLNNLALGIELENLNNGKQDYTAEQMDKTTRQILEWYGAYGYLPILSHASVDNRKTDPAGFN